MNILYELDRRNEWTEPDAWAKANPSLGAIKKLDDLQIKVERAKQNPVELSGVLCKEFNIRETIKTAWLSFEAISTKTNETVLFQIGYRADIKTTHVIRYKGVLYDITRVDVFEGYKADLTIYAKSA